MLMSRRYRVDNFFEENSPKREVNNVLDSHLESIYKKTDKVATSLEKYMGDVAELDKRIKDTFENQGFSPDEYIKVATALRLILNRLDDMEKHINSIGEHLNITDFKDIVG